MKKEKIIKEYKKGVNYFFVKKEVSLNEWNDFYSKDNSYTFIRKIEKPKGASVEVAFLVASMPDSEVEIITDINELDLINRHRKMVNIKPLALNEENISPVDN